MKTQFSCQFFLDRLNNSAEILGMCFAYSTCNMLLQDWIGSMPKRGLPGEQLDEIEKFSYLSSCISPSGRLSEEASSRMQKARLSFANWRHLWSLCCIQ